VLTVTELLQKLHGDEIFVFATVFTGTVVGGIIALTAIVTAHWRKSRQAEQEAFLKQEMLQRGMSAEEIVQVITATRVTGPEADSHAHARQARAADCRGHQA
jgi:hypothetical protein